MYLAIDIGGTKTLIALFSKHGRVVKKVKFKTAQGYKKFTADLIHHLGPFKKRKVKTIVVAIPGVVQKNCSAILGNREWGQIDLISPIKSVFSCPVYFENDANLASVFESKNYPGKTIFLTFSTGIGGGIAERGKILPESNKFEPGHKVYEFNGKKAEWEDIAASSALEKFYHVDRATDLRGKKVYQDVAARVALGLPDIINEYHPDSII
ncbi:ROK family protein [Candidatus Saccharibacteria bacterium]|nr:ROK family protein [Candidatus Saccharibacteria bacterium]